jgi:F-type H+-transporting ATPase subunit a
MGEHGTWFDYLNRFGWWRHFNESAEHALTRKWKFLMFDETGWTLNHVLTTLVVVLFVVVGAMAFRNGLKSKDQGLVPPRKMNLRNFMEVMAESVFGMVEGAMGEKHAKKFFPLIGALFFFILFGNMIGLIPGFVTPNDTLKTNVGIAVLVFVLTHYYGIKEHGVGRYLAHFAGPMPALAPLIIPIELISHFARPLSLAGRLLGNMMADHKVVMSFFALVPILVPIPFLLLGLLVCFIQALVFCTLAMVYIGMAMEHEGDDHH